MDWESRNRFFTAHYNEISALSSRATHRICQRYGWSLYSDVHAYVMEGIIRGLSRLEGVHNWRNFLYVYGYKNGLTGMLELRGLKRCRSQSTTVGVSLKYVSPKLLDELSWSHCSNAHMNAWMETTEFRLEQKCFFDQLRPSIERNVLGLLMAQKSRKSIVSRTRLNETSYRRVTLNLQQMYRRIRGNRSIDHLYVKSTIDRSKAIH